MRRISEATKTVARAAALALTRVRRATSSPAGADRALLGEIVKLERRLEKRKRRLLRRGTPVSPLNEPTIALAYSAAPIRIVASASSRRKDPAKEPFTIAWLENEVVPSGGVLYDIGANVGVYSLVAVLNPGSTVTAVAFEPAYPSYASLCSNIALNGVGDRIIAIPVALAEETALAPFHYKSLRSAAANHQLGGADFRAAHQQQMMVARLDNLVTWFGLPPPTHMKIDVDGLERSVLAGARGLLEAGAVESLLVELAGGDQQVIEQLLAGYGFHLASLHRTSYDTPYGIFNRQPS